MSRDDFKELDVITDEAGTVKAVLTYKHKDNGDKMLSVAFMREFDDNGVIRRTPWLSKRHLEAILRLLPLVKKRLSSEEEKMKIK